MEQGWNNIRLWILNQYDLSFCKHPIKCTTRDNIEQIAATFWKLLEVAANFKYTFAPKEIKRDRKGD